MENKINEQEIRNEMKKLVDEVEQVLRKAESFADKHNISFYFCPEYGMGGSYDGEEQQWYPSSSQNC